MSVYNKAAMPKDGISGLLAHAKNDILSGFMVSLLALPLSLGIAKASDFPNPMYGVLTAIIGGILVSILAGSRLTIKGPAAGLIVIVAGAVNEFGGGAQGWQMTLGVIVVAAIFQIAFGLLRLGKLADFFPLSAVHGMLAAIGLIIISKQLHILLGVNPVGIDGKPLVEPLALIEALPHTFESISTRLPLVLTGIISLSLVFIVPILPIPWLKKIPVPMVVLAVAIPLGQYLQLGTQKGGLLTFDKPFSALIGLNASFAGWSQPIVFIKYVILFALIGSLESLLTVKAIDLLDPYQRKSDANRDLIAVGIGNTVAGLLGGLPMISEVARSSANVSNQGKTRWANFFHGLFLLIFMLLLTPVIQMIPNAALAAMLIGVGYKLAHPREFVHALHIGKDQLAVFVVTIIFTLGVDLLVGVGAGIVTEMLLHLYKGAALKSLFTKPEIEITTEANNYYVRLSRSATFTNWLGIKKTLEALTLGANIFISLETVELVDHSVMKNLYHFKKEYETEGGNVEFVGLDTLTALSDHTHSARYRE